MTSNIRKGYRIIFIVTFIPALFFESLIFLRLQIENVRKVIEDDFRIVLITGNNKDVEKIKQSLLAIDGIRNVNFVSSQEIMQKIKDSDKDLYLSLVSIGHSAIPDIIELTVEYRVLTKIEELVDRIIKIDGIIDIKYKMLEAYALTHFAFYSNFISVVLSLGFFALIFLLIMGIVYSGVTNFFGSLKNAFKWFGTGILGGILATISFYIIIYPVKYLSPLWQWPPLLSHLLMIICCGLAGWVLYQWKNV